MSLMLICAGAAMAQQPATAPARSPRADRVTRLGSAREM